jgi:hypothetical protein
LSKGQVFVNCPFTPDYHSFFQAIVFTIIRSGFTPRCAREDDDGSDNRLNKILRIIGDCRFGIHDISKTEVDAESGLPRFNMPLELGLFLGAKKFGSEEQRLKRSLILDCEPYRYQKFISDISGHDIHSHDANISSLIVEVSGWLRSASDRRSVPGGAKIEANLGAFQQDLPNLCHELDIQINELEYVDMVGLMSSWISEVA